ncbi:cytochrome P450, family 704, subfamily A, polypeptide 2 [Actinidia rufa]|uniref:Cytochrome P450, family 704, subfamily A, polypeptide 2 n=1 Tax=Actinidia rufa TaxID=165716 RepID=A0A7J0E6B4_9ERIC|nr:cytochrome P450, family 704, subfamily A, polypeptide 2 [Actinidia rufa]
MMGVLFFGFTILLLLMGFFVGVSFILAVVGVLTFFVIGLVAVFLVAYIRELISKDLQAPVVGTVFNQLIHFNRLFDYQTSLARRYSTYRLVMLSHSEVYTADPVTVEYILKTKFSNYGRGQYHTGIMRDLFGDGIFAVDGEKMASPAEARPDLLMKSTLDSIFKVGFGVDLNTLSELRGSLTLAWKQFLNRTSKVIDNFVYELIRCKREQMKNGKLDRGKEDLLSRFLVESEKDPENMTDKYLRDITLNFTIAGKDTSANTLTWFFYMLCRHPFVQEKIAQEVREATETEKNVSTDEFANKLTEAALEKMHYLHAALTETLRLYPAVPVDGKISEEDDILPDGFKIKKGDGVNYMAYPMGRMTYIWGEDAEEFRPERWLDNGVFRAESPFKFTAFQAGPRICLGKEFAYRQMKILASSLLFFFKFKLVDESRKATYRTMFTLHMDKGLHLYAFSRLVEEKRGLIGDHLAQHNMPKPVHIASNVGDTTFLLAGFGAAGDSRDREGVETWGERDGGCFGGIAWIDCDFRTRLAGG